MRFGLAFFFLTYLLLSSCQNKEAKNNSVVQAIQQTGRLITAEYSVSKMVRADDNKTWYKWGDRRILLSTEAVVTAGVDLQTVTAADISIDQSNISVRLPPPQVFSVSLPPSKIKVLYEDVSAFRSRFSAGEREALLRQAEGQVRRLADSLGILATARTNADVFMRKLLQQAGFENISLRFEK